ncbi:uncharacterized protein LOC116956956 [Petromyzon marinus]|uniref:uncharacterized protein LOC116956956 n=1 Tax=Petromyzon marinus TaxID=7757 RepID=UPI003F72B39A
MAPTRDVLYLLTLLLLTIVCSITAQSDQPSDEEIKRKCGFSLKQIHDCKYELCLNATAVCIAKKTDQTAEDISNCQMEECMLTRKKCESPLNKYLSKEEICEGNHFTDTDAKCLVNSRGSMDALTTCKHNGYLVDKRVCFADEWKRRIEAHALKELNEHAITKEAEQCAYDTCFQRVEDCLSSHHSEIAKNPGSKRKFSLKECAYLAVDYPHECEQIKSISGCVDSLKDCIKKYPTPPPPPFPIGIIVGVLVGVVLLAGGGAFLYMRHKKMGPFRRPGNPIT